jgi:hypothetical protein
LVNKVIDKRNIPPHLKNKDTGKLSFLDKLNG